MRLAVGENARKILVEPRRHLLLHRCRVVMELDARDRGGDLLEVIETDERIDLGDRLLQVAAVLLDHAAGDDQSLESFPFASRHLEDRVDRFFLGGVDEPAGIDNKQASPARFFNRGIMETNLNG